MALNCLLNSCMIGKETVCSTSAQVHRQAPRCHFAVQMPLQNIHRWVCVTKHHSGLAQVNSEQSDAEADPSIEEGAAAREDSSDDDAGDDARYFDARELQRPSRSLSDDLDAAAAAAADGQASRCACPIGYRLRFRVPNLKPKPAYNLSCASEYLLPRS